MAQCVWTLSSHTNRSPRRKSTKWKTNRTESIDDDWWTDYNVGRDLIKKLKINKFRTNHDNNDTTTNVKSVYIQSVYITIGYKRIGSRLIIILLRSRIFKFDF